MIYPEADKLDNMGSKYGLVVLAAKRAKQIKSGLQPLIDTDSRNPLTIALEEIAAGKITCEVPDTDIITPVAEEPEVAQLLAIPERGEEEEEVESQAGGEEEELTLNLDENGLLEEETEEEDEEEEEVDLLAASELDEEDEDNEEMSDPKSKRKSKAMVDSDESDKDISVVTDGEQSED